MPSQDEGRKALPRGGRGERLVPVSRGSESGIGAGAEGRRSKRHGSSKTADPLPSLDTMKSVHEMNKRLFEEVYSGETSRSDASTLVRILKSITDSIRFTDHEQRLIKLEEARA